MGNLDRGWIPLYGGQNWNTREHAKAPEEKE